jgi:UDPglucose 6-dehydrogenase
MGGNMTNNLKIGIAGGGVVGRAIAAYYQNVKIYDKYAPRDSLEEVGAADFIFIAVPTPFNNGQDLTEMNDAVAKIVSSLKNPKDQIIIIKSTVLPGTTDDYQEKYPQVNFVFNPEFLTEKVAVGDFQSPDKQLVGYTAKTKDSASKVMDILPPAPYKKILQASVCEMAKYAINSFYSFKVIFANAIFDLCEKKEIDYNLVREGFSRDPRIIDSHFEVMHGGYRGYGGKCLKKDAFSLAWFAHQKNVDFRFIDEIIAINEKLIAKSHE